MTRQHWGTGVQDPCDIVAQGYYSEWPDGRLLGLFRDSGDGQAFTTLVERHWRLVRKVCNRILHHTQDAEDACQATFLVLVEHADSIRKQESLASWLHGVAYRTANHARTA